MTKELINMKYSYTSDGKPVRLLCTDEHEPFSVVGYVGDDFLPRALTNTGAYWESSVSTISDLIRVPTKREGWINLYQQGDTVLCGVAIHERPELAFAKTLQTGRALATIRIEWEE